MKENTVIELNKKYRFVQDGNCFWIEKAYKNKKGGVSWARCSGYLGDYSLVTYSMFSNMSKNIEAKDVNDFLKKLEAVAKDVKAVCNKLKAIQKASK